MPESYRADGARDRPDPTGVLVLCLLCGEHVRYESRRGDTRMRYSTHSIPLTRAMCPNSGEPVNAEGKT